MKSNHKNIYGSVDDIETGDDDMGDITLGDRTENHYHQEEKKSNSNLAKAAGIAALAMGTGGIGFAAPFVLDLLSEGKNIIDERVIEKDTRESIEILPPVLR